MAEDKEKEGTDGSAEAAAALVAGRDPGKRRVGQVIPHLEPPRGGKGWSEEGPALPATSLPQARAPRPRLPILRPLLPRPPRPPLPLRARASASARAAAQAPGEADNGVVVLCGADSTAVSTPLSRCRRRQAGSCPGGGHPEAIWARTGSCRRNLEGSSPAALRPRPGPAWWRSLPPFCLRSENAASRSQPLPERLRPAKCLPAPLNPPGS